MTDTITRPAPPPLVPRCPDCSICGAETYFEDGGFRCDDCCAWWDETGLDQEPGEWDEPERPQCPVTVQPYRYNDYITDPAIRSRVYRCVLSEGHADEHAHPDVYGYVNWSDHD